MFIYLWLLSGPLALILVVISLATRHKVRLIGKVGTARVDQGRAPGLEVSLRNETKGSIFVSGISMVRPDLPCFASDLSPLGTPLPDELELPLSNADGTPAENIWMHPGDVRNFYLPAADVGKQWRGLEAVQLVALSGDFVVCRIDGPLEHLPLSSDDTADNQDDNP